MKRFLTLLVVAVCGMGAVFAEDVMQVTPFKVQSQSGSFDVSLRHDGHNFKAFQVDLLLPSGLTLDATAPFTLKTERNTNNDIDVFCWGTQPNYLVPAGVPEGYTYYRIVAYKSAGGENVFSGTSGDAIMTVNYTSHSLTDGTIYNVYTTNMEFAYVDNSFVRPGDALATKASSYLEVGTPELVDPETHESKVVLSDYVPEAVVEELQSAVEGGALSVDLTNVTDMGKDLEFSGTSANVMQVVTKDTPIEQRLTENKIVNVIVKDENEYSCDNFTLTDKVDYKPSVEEFKAQKVVYERTNTGGMNSVCLPFEVDVTDFNGCDVYVFNKVKTSTVSFTQQTSGKIAAGTPMLVQDNKVGNAAVWEFTLSTSASKNEPIAAEGDGAEGAFVGRTLGESANFYKLNSAGTAFGKAKSSHTITPFRFYIKTSNAASASRLDLELSDEEGNVTYIGGITREGEVSDLHDLQGRRVENAVKGQTYVKGGKKILY